MNETATAFSKAKTEITKLRAAIVEKTMKLAAEIQKLEQHAAIEEAHEFLVARCGLSASDIRLYGKIGKRLSGFGGVLEKRGVSYEMVKSLATAKETVRGRALSTIASGARFDHADLRVLRRQVAEHAMSAHTFGASKHRRAMKVLAEKRAKASVSKFEAGAAELLNAMASLRHPDTEKPTAASLSAIATKARTLMPTFEAAFGAEHPQKEDADWQNLNPKAREAASLHRTIKDLTGITEGSARAVQERATKLATTSTGPMSTLARFAGNEDYMSMLVPPPRKPLKELPAKRLRALELCAGAGGMALGLEAAGFDHVALVEFDTYAAATMRRNRPDWPVIKKDMTKIDFRPYAGKVDLVCGGIPCQPYSEEGKGKGGNDERDLLLEGARAVREIQPRAFLFENVRGVLFGKHSDHVARFLKELNEAGYDVHIVDVNTQDYGIAQNRPRVLFVGLRTQDRRNFEMPRKFPNRRANVADVLYDLMAAKGWSEVDAWAEYCRTVSFELQDGTVVQGAQASTLLGRKGKAREREALRWAKNGLDPSGFPESAPTDELARKKGPGFVPGLTTRMRARLQNFPDSYDFVGSKDSVAKQIGNAVAPRLAQAAGLALYAVLEGIKLDIEAILWPDSPRPVRISVTPPPLDIIVSQHETEKA